MASRFSTISLDHIHAARARHVANHLGIPVSALLSTLIDQSYEHELGIRPSFVTAGGGDLVIELGSDRVLLPVDSGPAFSKHLRKIADEGGAFMDMDSQAMISISRQGSAVLIETRDKAKIKHTMGAAAAKRLADEIAEYSTMPN